VATKGPWLIRAIVFGLMVPGLALVLWGTVVELKSYRAPGQFEGGPSPEELDRRRHQAQALKNGGVALVLAGPGVGFAGWLLNRGRNQQL
jgi:hypothetical protein